MNLLQNKVAVITGGTRGLGLGIAQSYAAEGAAVVVAGRSQTTIDKALTELHANGAPTQARTDTSLDIRTIAPDL